MTPRSAAVDICVRVFKTKGYSDILLRNHPFTQRCGDKDKALLYEIVNGSIRWKLTLEYWLSRIYRGSWDSVPEQVKWILLTALYQLHFLDRVPGFAAVNEAVNLAGKISGGRWPAAVNGILRNIIRNPRLLTYPQGDTRTAGYLSVRWSHPEWLVSRLLSSFGYDKTAVFCRANNERPDWGVRVNTLKCSISDFSDHAVRENIDVRASGLLPEFFIMEKSAPLMKSQLFLQGSCSLQDVSAGFAGRLTAPRPQEIILDMAAAPGGKSTHIAELGDDRSLIVSMDVNLTRLKKLVLYRKRLGIKKLFPILGDGRKALPLVKPDKIILDAPCSGFGVLRKRSELRWHRDQQDIDALIRTQTQMLTAAAKAVKPGGIIVYSTCSVLPEENEAVVEDLLQRRKDIILEDPSPYVDPSVVTAERFVRTWPDIQGIDGVFAARLKKVE